MVNQPHNAAATPLLDTEEAKGKFMRLVELMFLTEVQWDFTRAKGDFKMLLALRRQVDGKVADYFAAEKKTFSSPAAAVPTRWGFFMRRLADYRQQIDHYYRSGRSKSDLERLWPVRQSVVDGIEAFFNQFPNQRREAVQAARKANGTQTELPL